MSEHYPVAIPFIDVDGKTSYPGRPWGMNTFDLGREVPVTYAEAPTKPNPANPEAGGPVHLGKARFVGCADLARHAPDSLDLGLARGHGETQRTDGTWTRAMVTLEIGKGYRFPDGSAPAMRNGVPVTRYVEDTPFVDTAFWGPGSKVLDEWAALGKPSASITCFHESQSTFAKIAADVEAYLARDLALSGVEVLLSAALMMPFLGSIFGDVLQQSGMLGNQLTGGLFSTALSSMQFQPVMFEVVPGVLPQQTNAFLQAVSRGLAYLSIFHNAFLMTIEELTILAETSEKKRDELRQEYAAIAAEVAHALGPEMGMAIQVLRQVEDVAQTVLTGGSAGTLDALAQAASFALSAGEMAVNLASATQASSDARATAKGLAQQDALKLAGEVAALQAQLDALQAKAQAASSAPGGTPGLPIIAGVTGPAPARSWLPWAAAAALLVAAVASSR